MYILDQLNISAYPIFVTHDNTFDLTVLPTKRRGSSFKLMSPLICKEENQIMEMGNFIII